MAAMPHMRPSVRASKKNVLQRHYYGEIVAIECSGALTALAVDKNGQLKKWNARKSSKRNQRHSENFGDSGCLVLILSSLFLFKTAQQSLLLSSLYCLLASLNPDDSKSDMES